VKPAVYAASGIPHFWRVDIAGPAVVHTYDLDADLGSYAPTGTREEHLTIECPRPL
jgi:hypothetical protein